MSSAKTTPPLRGTPPEEGNKTKNSPPLEGWQAQPDGVVPRLRFPEFREAGEWEEKPLGAVCGMQAGKFVAASEISERQAEGLYPCFGGNGLRGYTKTFNQSGRYSLIGRQGALCGNVNLAEGNFYATEHAVVTTPKPGTDTDWLFYNLCLLNLNRFATGQAQPGLSIDVLEKVNCAVPKNKSEQQKIADCLASLDELITLEAQKLDTLKTHKKGLMQQLFPAEGETLPKLRFPEFRDVGEWEPKSIGRLGEVVTGSTPSTAQPEYYGGEKLFVSPADISDDRFIEKTKTSLTELGFRETRPIKANSILFVCIGSTIGKIAQNRNECATNQQINSVITNSENSDGFVYYALGVIADKIANLAGKQAVPIVNKSLFSSVELTVPKPPEQNRIADCLASLDNLITTQTQKLAALKTHKKGLMQGLFPSIGGVDSGAGRGGSM